MLFFNGISFYNERTRHNGIILFFYNFDAVALKKLCALCVFVENNSDFGITGNNL